MSSDPHETVTGYSDEEFKRLHVLEMFPEDDRKHIEKAMSEVLSQEEASVEANVLTKNGVEIPYFFTAGLRSGQCDGQADNCNNPDGKRQYGKMLSQ